MLWAVCALAVRSQLLTTVPQLQDQQLMMIVTELQAGPPQGKPLQAGHPIPDDVWMMVSLRMPGRDRTQVAQRWRNMLNPELKKGPWTEEVRADVATE